MGPIITVSYYVHFTCVESAYLFTSNFSLEVVAMYTPLEVSAMNMNY